MEGPGQERSQPWRAEVWCTPLQGMVKLLSTSSSGCLSTRNLCLFFPTGFFISLEMKTSQNSKCQKHHCPVCAIIMLLRKLLKVLHFLWFILQLDQPCETYWYPIRTLQRRQYDIFFKTKLSWANKYLVNPSSFCSQVVCRHITNLVPSLPKINFQVI